MKRTCKLAVASALSATLWAVTASAAPNAKNDEQQTKFQRYCANARAPNGERFAQRLSGRLDLRDAQKPALNELRDAFAKSMADAKSALCGMKPDFATTPGRFAFAKKKAETAAERMKTLEPKLTAFYAALDDKQKASLDAMQLWAPQGRKAKKEDTKKTDGDNDDE